MLADLPDGGVAAFLDKDMNLVAKDSAAADFVRIVYDDGRTVFGVIEKTKKAVPVVSIN